MMLTELLPFFRAECIEACPYGRGKEARKCGLKANYEILRDDAQGRFVVEQQGACVRIFLR